MVPCLVVGICGGTGSGKTTLAQRIASELSADTALLLQQDHYYKELPAHYSDSEFAHHNFDHPDSVDTELLVRQLAELKAGKPVDRPVYDFTLHRRRAESLHLEPRAAIILEGILVFENAALRELMDVKIFVDTDADIRFIRRLERDIRERGRTVESVVHQYLMTVRPMHLEFVEPSKRYADVIIPEGGRNGVGADLVIQKIRSLMGFRASPFSNEL